LVEDMVVGMLLQIRWEELLVAQVAAVAVDPL
jgi:hypothetical protein